MGIIQKQGFYNALISYFGIGIGFLNVLILQPIMLTPEEIGLTRILFSTSTFIATIFPLGLNGVIIKFLPRFRNINNGNNGFLGFVLLSSIICYIILTLFLQFLEPWFVTKYSNNQLFIDFKNYILPFSFFIGISGILNVYLFSSFRTVFPTFINDLFLRIYMTALVCLYFLKFIHIKEFVQIFVGGYLLQLTVLLIYILRKEGYKVLRINKDILTRTDTRKIFKFSLSMSLITICNMALKSIDIIMLGSYETLDQVAVYSIALLISGFIELPASAIGKIADSNISDSYQKNDLENINKIYTESTKILLALGCLLFILININSKDLLSFLPEKYANGSTVIFITSFAALSNMGTGINSSILFYTNQTKWGTLLMVLLLALMIILNLLMIPIYGILGAALSVAISFTIFNFCKFILIKKLFNFNPYTYFSFQIFIFSLFLFGLTYFIQFNNVLFAICVKSFIVIIGYLYFLYHSKQFTKQFESVTKRLFFKN